MAEIQVDDKGIRKLGDTFGGLVGTDADPALADVNGITDIKAGTFDEATKLVGTITDRVGEVSKNLGNIKTALDKIGNDLYAVADAYKNTEEDSTVQVSI